MPMFKKLKIALTNKCVCICECEIYSCFSISTNINIGRYPTYIHEDYLVYTLKIYIDRWKFEFHRREETSIYNIWSEINYSHIPTFYMESNRKQNTAKQILFVIYIYFFTLIYDKKTQYRQVFLEFFFFNQCFTGFWIVLWMWHFQIWFPIRNHTLECDKLTLLLLVTYKIKSHYML